MTTPLPPPPPVPPRLHWVPTLDGLRGLAVLAVVAFHAGHLQGGYLGVDLFFTVSGFLITRLILDDLGRGRFRLTSFWARRARRLLPALWLLLAVMILVSPWLVERSSGTSLRRSVVATASYVANWWQLSGPASYWEAFGTPSPLNHTWSLAIEEQFYVVWPIVALIVWRVARRPARALLVVALAAVVSSMIAQAVLYQPGSDGARAYLGTDTRAASILLGCAAALAMWTQGHRVRPEVWHRLHLLAPLSLITIVVIWFYGRPGAWLYRGGFPLLALAAAVILASSAAPTPSRLNRALGWAPLVLVGQVSYGIYLWHWPVFTLLGPEQLHVAWLAAPHRPPDDHRGAGLDLVRPRRAPVPLPARTDPRAIPGRRRVRGGRGGCSAGVAHRSLRECGARRPRHRRAHRREPGVHLVSWRVGHTRPRHRPVDGAGDHDRPLDDRTPHDDDHAPYHCTQHDGRGDHVDHAGPDHDRRDHHHHGRPACAAPGVPSAAAAAGGG